MNYEIQTWPRINISFPKVKFFWYFENYFYRADNNAACLCLKSHNFCHIIFGSNFMRRKDVIFGIKGRRICFEYADCSKIIFKNYTEYNENNNTNITTNITDEALVKKRNIISIVLNGTEFIKEKNNELIDIRDYNLFNRIINI